MNTKLSQFLSALWQGGAFGHYFTMSGPDRGAASHWFEVGKASDPPNAWAVYMGVHPAREIPTRNAEGKPARPIAVRAQMEFIAAINCLFAEFDDKDFGGHAEALAHIDGLPLTPSVLIDSGGGYHAYWLLDKTLSLTDRAARSMAGALQARWVHAMGGDKRAKDLARVLRVPGTMNGKYNPARPVTFVRADFDKRYTLAQLEDCAPVTKGGQAKTIRNPRAYADGALANGAAKVAGAREGERNDTLFKEAAGLGSLVSAGMLDSNRVEDTLISAAENAGLTEREAARTVRSGLSNGMANPREIPTNGASEHHAGVSAPQPDLGEFLRNARMTDLGNAECLEALRGEVLRFDHTRAKWVYWDGQRWQVDRSDRAQRHMRDTVRARQAQIANVQDEDAKRRYASFVIGSENVRKLQAALQVARSQETFATTIELYDRDPMRANAGPVTLDLATGTARENRRQDYITRRIGPNYDANATCPRWLQFMREIFEGDIELITYIQRAVGYTLTGDTREQKLFLCYGTGANGKSVFLDTLGSLLGEYSASRAFSTFDADQQNRVGDDLAGLKGARLVLVIETDEDRRLNEARIKVVTGQDSIACRYLFGEWFNFRPEFKLWLAMNHKPNIYGTDRGIWRRIQLIPFNVSFEGREDKTLETKLAAELPGILNWALEGLRAWNRIGLMPPQRVVMATDEYRRESDAVGQWLEAYTIAGEQMAMKSGDAYASFKSWCGDVGLKPFTQMAWARRMAEHGLTAIHTRTGSVYQGVGLLTA